MPNPHQSLVQLAVDYVSQYVRKEPITDLISAMFAMYLEIDRKFPRKRSRPKLEIGFVKVIL
jgi:hypothetical protein